MLTLFCQSICSFLFLSGFFFIFISLRSKFDIIYLYFGILTIELSFFSIVEFWLNQNVVSSQNSIFYYRLRHCIACFIIPSLYVVVFQLTNTKRKKFILFIFFISFIFALLFFSDIFINNKSQTITLSLYYIYLFFPFSLSVFVHLNFHLILNYNKMSLIQKKILKYYLTANMCLFIFGIIDIILIIVTDFHSFTITIFGIFLFVLIVSLGFIEQLSNLINDRKTLLKSLSEAYKDLEQANALKKIGQSTMFINHEIKNFVYLLNGNLQLLLNKNKFPRDVEKKIFTILNIVTQMKYFTKDNLELSKSYKIVENSKENINILGYIKEFIEKNFVSKINQFDISGINADCHIFQNKGKFDQILVNLINNSFEAKTNIIQIRALKSNQKIFLSFEDFGIGCHIKNINKVFNAFFSSKKETDGTGLGLSIVKGIVESNEGSIQVYTKNKSIIHSNGFIVNIVLPSLLKNKEGNEMKYDILIVKDGMHYFGDIYKVFQHADYKPYTIPCFKDFNKFNSILNKPIKLISVKSVLPISNAQKTLVFREYITENIDNITYIRKLNKSQLDIFNEEWIANLLIDKR